VLVFVLKQVREKISPNGCTELSNRYIVKACRGREHSIEANCLIGIDNREIPLVIATNMTLFNRYGIDSAHCVDYDIENTAFASHEITLITDAFTSY